MTRVSKAFLLAAISIVSTLAIWLFTGLTTVRQNFDGPYYAVVAKSLYDKNVIRSNFSFNLPLEYYPAHLPLFPLLMRLGGMPFRINYLDVGLAINLLISAATVVVIYYWSDSFWVGLGWLFLWPRIWAVRSIASPESLFILAIVLSVWAFKHKKYFWAGLTGAVAVLTKSPGILLFAAYGIWALVETYKTAKIPWKIWPVVLIPLALVGTFYFYQIQTGDFMAYFHSGDNIHLQLLPFRVFDSSQPWVGDFWLEDVLWIYLVAGIGIYNLLKKDFTVGIFPAVFYTVILFVSHRDISRYALPLVPFVLLGLTKLFDRKEVRVGLILFIIPCFFYTANFITHNQVAISNWMPFFSR